MFLFQLFKKFFDSDIKKLLAHERRIAEVDVRAQLENRRKQLEIVELESLVGKKVISVTNNVDGNVTVGICDHIQYLTRSECPVPVVKIPETGEEILTFGLLFLYTDELKSALDKLTPSEIIALLYRH